MRYLIGSVYREIRRGCGASPGDRVAIEPIITLVEVSLTTFPVMASYRIRQTFARIARAIQRWVSFGHQ